MSCSTSLLWTAAWQRSSDDSPKDISSITGCTNDFRHECNVHCTASFRLKRPSWCQQYFCHKSGSINFDWWNELVLWAMDQINSEKLHLSIIIVTGNRNLLSSDQWIFSITSGCQIPWFPSFLLWILSGEDAWSPSVTSNLLIQSRLLETQCTSQLPTCKIQFSFRKVLVAIGWCIAKPNKMWCCIRFYELGSADILFITPLSNCILLYWGGRPHPMSLISFVC